MKLLSRLVLLSFFLLGQGACSIYRNKGRDQFEARASGNVKTEIGSALSPNSQDPEDFSSCWVQSMNEPLWSFPADSRLHIRHLQNDQMAVCLQSPEDRLFSESDFAPQFEDLR